MGGRPVVIVGAGIVGVATALWLQRAGRAVVLVDPAGPGEGASLGNGGVLAAAAVVPVTVPGLLGHAPALLARGPLFLRWRHLPRLAPWLRRYLAHCAPAAVERIATGLRPLLEDSLAEHQALAAGTGAAHFVVPCDYAYLYADRAAFATDGFGWEVRRRQGVRWSEEPAAAFHAAGFDPGLGLAVRMGGHGRIEDPGAYVKALAAHIEAGGGRLLRGRATAVAREGGRVAGVVVDGELLPASDVVIAAGAWSGGLAADLGLRVPIESERGYHLELWEPSAMPPMPAMVAKAKFVVTPMAGRIRLAGLVEFGGLAAGPSAAPLRFLRAAARRALPGLAWARETAWMGHRPVTPDSLPLIGGAPGLAGAWLGFGHHHVGLTAGAVTGRLLAQLVTGARVNIDLAPYAPARFQ